MRSPGAFEGGQKCHFLHQWQGTSLFKSNNYAKFGQGDVTKVKILLDCVYKNKTRAPNVFFSEKKRKIMQNLTKQSH